MKTLCKRLLSLLLVFVLGLMPSVYAATDQGTSPTTDTATETTIPEETGEGTFKDNMDDLCDVLEEEILKSIILPSRL